MLLFRYMRYMRGKYFQIILRFQTESDIRKANKECVWKDDRESGKKTI